MKERRGFIRMMATFAGLLALPAARNYTKGNNMDSSPAVAGEIGGAFVHTVLFWLVDETSSTRERFVKELTKFIDHVAEIRTKHVGMPADTEREVIDNSYSYCLIVTFDSRKEHDIYQDHPLHQQFIENASGLWKRVLVYDSVRYQQP